MQIQFFTDRTIIAEPLPEELSEGEKQNILEERNRILTKVKDYIDSNLDPRKVNIIDPSESDYVKPLNIPDILNELNITEDQYYKAFVLHLQRPTDSCFVNNYFTVCVLGKPTCLIITKL